MNCYLSCGFLLKLTPRAFYDKTHSPNHTHSYSTVIDAYALSLIILVNAGQLSVYYLAQGYFDIQELGINQLIF